MNQSEIDDLRARLLCALWGYERLKETPDAPAP